MAFGLRRKTRALPDPEQVALINLSQTWGERGGERIQQTFEAYASQGFAGNSVVFACLLARMQLLAQAEFRFQNIVERRLFWQGELEILETPWPNGTTADLIARMLQHADLAGNAFVRRAGDQLVVMRPDWTDIVGVEVIDGYDDDGNPKIHREVLGYLYSEGGPGKSDPVFYDVTEVAHWTPLPDPLARWRGMSWLTPVLREINADTAMTQHRQTFFDNAATPNIMLKYQQRLTPDHLERIRAQWNARYAGPRGAGSTVVLDEGADFTVVGQSFEAMRFNDVQAAGEARIASAAGVPAIVAGLQAGLDAATYSNYASAIKAMSNGTGAYLWRSLCSSLQKLVAVPGGSRLWWDQTNIPALQENEKDRADAMSVLAAAASTLLTAGYTAESITKALTSGDLSLLEHTGMISVQLIPADAAALKAQQATITNVDKAEELPSPGPARARADMNGVPISVNVYPQVTVEPAQVNVQPTPVDVQVAAPQVTVEPAQVRVDAPVVNVDPTPVTVSAPVTVLPATTEVKVVPMPPTTRKVKRDSQGNITAVVEE